MPSHCPHGFHPVPWHTGHCFFGAVFMFWEPSNRDDAGRARRRRAGAGAREDDERVADADADDADATDGDGRTNMTRARVREWEWGQSGKKRAGWTTDSIHSIHARFRDRVGA